MEHGNYRTIEWKFESLDAGNLWHGRIFVGKDLSNEEMDELKIDTDVALERNGLCNFWCKNRKRGLFKIKKIIDMIMDRLVGPYQLDGEKYNQAKKEIDSSLSLEPVGD